MQRAFSPAGACDTQSRTAAHARTAAVVSQHRENAHRDILKPKDDGGVTESGHAQVLQRYRPVPQALMHSRCDTHPTHTHPPCSLPNGNDDQILALQMLSMDKAPC